MRSERAISRLLSILRAKRARCFSKTTERARAHERYGHRKRTSALKQVMPAFGEKLRSWKAKVTRAATIVKERSRTQLIK
ncbi:hypothetical protein NDU88_009040 [Pleurodeles waltl]|uniref:Uncharacterized protein n=1 Tax=Pleurodeles waltl TaxID=8319 RepID=A0AAV7QTH0_PLEWA|nr:hypothetical protein NDU88_009040 [Pleurodeles waltl]